MKKKFKIAVIALLCIAAVVASIVFLSTQNIAVLNPKGMIAIKQRQLLLTATWLMLIVVVPVFIMTLAFAWKYREKNRTAKYAPDWEHNYLAEILWWGIPFIIIVILAVITWDSSHELSPYKPIENGKKQLKIQVVALEWKWLFIYPEQGIAVVNFVQFPEKTPISFEITADAPMNSFWIPQLGGQIYAMPAMATRLHLIANEIGQFRGSSANLSGAGFAGMTFMANSSSQEDFDAWVQSVKVSSSPLGLEEYAQLMKQSQYDAVKYYALMQNDLFDQIVMKYFMPQK